MFCYLQNSPTTKTITRIAKDGKLYLSNIYDISRDILLICPVSAFTDLLNLIHIIPP
jgi:hypothetical protein